MLFFISYSVTPNGQFASGASSITIYIHVMLFFISYFVFGGTKSAQFASAPSSITLRVIFYFVFRILAPKSYIMLFFI